LSEPAHSERTRPVLDIRVGSATNALQPVSIAERSLGAGLAQWVSVGLVASAAVIADQLTKWVVSSRLDIGGAAATIGPFSIHHVQNSGIAFGLFASATSLVIVATGIAVAWMLFYFARSGARHPVLPVALGLVIGGSASNLLDRVRLGYVTDFLDLRYWPAFNLADSFIVVGVGILLAALLAVEREPRRGQFAATNASTVDRPAGCKPSHPGVLGRADSDGYRRSLRPWAARFSLGRTGTHSRSRPRA